MTPLVWLAVAAIAAGAAFAVGWPAWRSSRGRDERDLNAERYRAWRGQAVRGKAGAPRGMTADERRRLYAAGALALLAVAALVAFFVAS